MNPLHGQQVLVLGLGESGLAMARWCARQGASVSVWDSRETPPQLAALRESLPGAVLHSGELTTDVEGGEVCREATTCVDPIGEDDRLIHRYPPTHPG